MANILLRLKCSRCGYAWWPKKRKKPSTCPKCRSPYWNKPRIRKGEDNEKNCFKKA